MTYVDIRLKYSILNIPQGSLLEDNRTSHVSTSDSDKPLFLTLAQGLSSRSSLGCVNPGVALSTFSVESGKVTQDPMTRKFRGKL